MVKIKYSSSVKVVVNNYGKITTQLVHDYKRGDEAWAYKTPKRLQLPQDIEKQLSELTDHFDSKLESLNNLILKELDEKINKIEKSVKTIGQVHEILIEKIGKLELIISRMKNQQEINVQMQEIEDLKQQISLLQTKVSAIQEQKQMLISRMNNLDDVKQHTCAMEKQHCKGVNSYETLGIQNELKTEELVSLMSKLTTNNPNTPKDLNKIIDRVPRHTKKRRLSKNAVVRFKFTHLKNKFLDAARIMRLKQYKGQAV
ncbi:hypothetical protein O0L34_g7060 [Tuta absoluta]|nr:hypothetical protein O0L34_g7060 [Tuta absoluta]